MHFRISLLQFKAWKDREREHSLYDIISPQAFFFCSFHTQTSKAGKDIFQRFASMNPLPLGNNIQTNIYREEKIENFHYKKELG